MNAAYVIKRKREKNRFSHRKHACVCTARPYNPRAKTYCVKRPHGFSFTFKCMYVLKVERRWEGKVL